MADAPGLGIVLASGSHERAHAAFLLAAGAASLGRSVIFFATGPGVLALCHDLALLPDHARDAQMMQRGVAGLQELRSACCELGVELLACPSGLLGEALDPAALMAGVAVEGMARFLEATRQHQLISL